MSLHVSNLHLKQTELVNWLLNNKEEGQLYQKMPVCAIPLNENNIDKVLKIAKDQIGIVDATQYPDNARQRYLGGALICQWTGETRDIYPIVADIWKNYEPLPANDISEDTVARIFSALPVLEYNEESKESEDLKNHDLKEEALIVRNVVKRRFVPLSELGHWKNNRYTIETAWGGSQIKPAGCEGFIALIQHENGTQEASFANEDPNTGCPSNWVLVNL